ncbi:serine/threonine protein kinase [Archangium gephyra]|uniref:Serine/threonine-protein kinase Pkn6 n=1 Tax=Archangium gephyra TaxID=48 RepID=A0AAC8TC56_9BACT|nr:Serine/threonine-protein kinase Pkn6 [Archangium gephyra]
MAEVYLAKAAGPRGFEKTLVLKRILPHLAEDPQFVEMFLGEATLAAQLEHPNVVQIFDFGEADGAYYLAMEYIDGPNLRTLSKHARAAGVALAPVCCARIIASACEGLAFAHDFADPKTGEPLGLIHRDISPDNILLSRQGAVKVVDFGIAKAINQTHKTQTGLIKGKIAYMSPEQIQARPFDRRVDVYALGIVLYELLTGQKPFDATTDVSMIQAIVSEPLVPAVSRRPDLPRALGNILAKALSKEPEQRYPDCRAFQADLEHFIRASGESVGAYQLSRLVAQVCGDHSGHGPRPPPGSSPKNLPGGDTPNATLAAAEDPALSPRGTGRWTALAGLALFAVSGGFLLFRASGSTQTGPPVPAVTLPATPIPLGNKQPDIQPTIPSRPLEAPPSSPPKATKKRVVQRESVEQESPTPETHSPPSSVGKGRLEFRIRPYATVFLDGRQLGRTPVAPLEIEAGTHTVRLINQESGKDVARTIELRAGQSLIFKYNLLED